MYGILCYDMNGKYPVIILCTVSGLVVKYLNRMYVYHVVCMYTVYTSLLFIKVSVLVAVIR